MVVESDGLYTCCGGDAARDLALSLVYRFCGSDVMTDCARWFLMDLPRLRPSVPPPLFAEARTRDLAMRRVEQWLQANFGSAVRFDAVARKFGMSGRTFHRRFREAFGDPPKVYVQKLRLDAARHLLETKAMPIDSVARRVGYDDPVFFRTLFKRHSGMTPAAYREKFHARAIAAPQAAARRPAGKVRRRRAAA
jgi:transcriptional regulator GlxA family with amidase domain